ncbi:MAG TPA: hypothetical protein VMB18_00815 [Terriglobales bacterium]|nr:hypothetical protein [Terriglobales bacterium]
MPMKPGCFELKCCTILVILAATLCAAQTPYQPKFPGDPAHSDSEAAALGYMRTLLRAQHTYKKKNGKYATSLAELVHTGTFTKRMTNLDQGDYTVSFHAHKDKDEFELLMTPKQQDPDHRSFFSKEDGVIHVEETQPANENSPKLK